ncbi:hypothetical protein HPB49_026539 [Dermacentor silvarum]|nr:hypothetical protein HPB49_026539 [Dermacentor silvarum]
MQRIAVVLATICIVAVSGDHNCTMRACIVNAESGGCGGPSTCGPLEVPVQGKPRQDSFCRPLFTPAWELHKLRGCVCKQRYLRNSWGECIPRKKCIPCKFRWQRDYRTCAPGCPATCNMPFGTSCNKPCTAGCDCPPGWVVECAELVKLAIIPVIPLLTEYLQQPVSDVSADVLEAHGNASPLYEPPNEAASVGLCSQNDSLSALNHSWNETDNSEWRSSGESVDDSSSEYSSGESSSLDEDDGQDERTDQQEQTKMIIFCAACTAHPILVSWTRVGHITDIVHHKGAWTAAASVILRQYFYYKSIVSSLKVFTWQQ